MELAKCKGQDAAPGYAASRGLSSSEPRSLMVLLDPLSTISRFYVKQPTSAGNGSKTNRQTRND